MTQVTIYHDPNSGASCKALTLIRSAGIEPTVIYYLKTPPTRTELILLIADMGIPIRTLLRRIGTPYTELDLDAPDWTDDELIDLMLKHPTLINGPIVVTPCGSKLCLSSESVLDLLRLPQRQAFSKDARSHGQHLT